MFNGMGVQWAGTLLGCVAVALVPIPVLFYLYGAKIRARSKFAPTMPPQRQAQPADEETGNVDAEIEPKVEAETVSMAVPVQNERKDE